MQDAVSGLLEIAAQLDDGAHGARMAPRRGLEGPRQARQGCSRYRGHGALNNRVQRRPWVTVNCCRLYYGAQLLSSARIGGGEAVERGSWDGDRGPSFCSKEP